MHFNFIPEDQAIFPHPSLAGPDGIVAIGSNLKAQTLITAYSFGIFPWFNEDQPIIWWSPDPRFVLFPEELKISKSMRSYFNQNKFRCTFDHAFDHVILACQRIKRQGQYGTWITEDMKSAYKTLHRLGVAHSVEVWNDDMLVGGLYGLSIGKMFFGESMFALESNASKFGFISLIKTLKAKGYFLIDCQQETKHLKSLGARGIPRNEFLDFLARNRKEDNHFDSWDQWSSSY